MFMNLKDRLRHSLIMAQADTDNRTLDTEARGDGSSSMRVLVDKAGHGLALKIWRTYIDEDGMKKFPSFMAALDNLLADFGAGKPEDSDPKHPKVRDDEDETGEKPVKKPKANKSNDE